MPPRTLYALSSLLFLVQVPHLAHLPLWVSAAGISLVVCRLALLKNPHNALLSRSLSPVVVTTLAACSALLIRWDFGYLIGRDPCVAFLFILVAAKFAEVRRASDATMLLCLCSFLLLTQYFYAQSIVSALVTLPCVIALGYSLSVLRDAQNPMPTKAQLKLVGTLLLQGLPLAVLLFFLFPRLPGPIWSLPEDAIATTGLSDSMSPGTIGELSQSSAVAFRVDFDSTAPSTDQLYWRGPVLTRFDGRNWGLSHTRFDASPVYSGSDSQVVDYTVTLQPHRQRWLFALDLATALPSAFSASDSLYSPPIGQMYSDGQILAKKNVSQTLRYRQSSYLSDAIPGTGSPPNDTLYLPGKNSRTIEFARELRAQHGSDEAFADALIRHFNEKPFRYTLRPQLLGDAPVDEFMFDTREGFCEHYASAFVVAMRAAGIAARVVTGYQGGEMNDDYMIVRQSDAHAWTEAYISGQWQRYDPTHAVAPQRVEQGLAAALPNESYVPQLSRHAPGVLRDMQLRWDALNHQWQTLVIDFDNDSQASLWDRTGFGKPDIVSLSVIVMSLAGLWCMLLLGLPRWSNRHLPPEERYWLSLTRSLHTHQLSRQNTEGPHEYLARAAASLPTQQPRLEDLSKAFDVVRFQQVPSGKRMRILRQIRRDIFQLKLSLRFARNRQ